MEGTTMPARRKMILAAIAALLIWKYIQFEGSTGALVERFPDVDPSIVRKVHKEMYKEALAGKYNQMGSADEDWDTIFKVKLMKYLPK